MECVSGCNISRSADSAKMPAAGDQVSAREAMLAVIPNLRAFAMSLCGSPDRADDLVQETLLRGLTSIHLFKPGTNMAAWLFTILRNQFYSEYRKRKHESEYNNELFLSSPRGTAPEQYSQVEFTAFRSALMQLPAEQREALILIAASGFSQEQAAEISGCATGTIKSRVHRARTRLAHLMHVSDVDFGPDGGSLAVVA